MYIRCVVVSNLFDLIPLKINSPNLPWNSFSVDRAEVPVNLRDLVNLQESFPDKSRWTVRDLLEDSQWPVPLFMLQFVDDQIRFERQTLFAPIFHNARFESFRTYLDSSNFWPCSKLWTIEKLAISSNFQDQIFLDILQNTPFQYLNLILLQFFTIIPYSFQFFSLEHNSPNLSKHPPNFQPLPGIPRVFKPYFTF